MRPSKTSIFPVAPTKAATSRDKDTPWVGPLPGQRQAERQTETDGTRQTETERGRQTDRRTDRRTETRQRIARNAKRTKETRWFIFSGEETCESWTPVSCGPRRNRPEGVSGCFYFGPSSFNDQPLTASPGFTRPPKRKACLRRTIREVRRGGGALIFRFFEAQPKHVFNNEATAHTPKHTHTHT